MTEKELIESLRKLKEENTKGRVVLTKREIIVEQAYSEYWMFHFRVYDGTGRYYSYKFPMMWDTMNEFESCRDWLADGNDKKITEWSKELEPLEYGTEEYERIDQMIDERVEKLLPKYKSECLYCLAESIEINGEKYIDDADYRKSKIDEANEAIHTFNKQYCKWWCACTE